KNRGTCKGRGIGRRRCFFVFCLEGKWLKYAVLCSVSLFTVSAPLSALKQVDTAMNRRKENAV
ncbi:hypothetical protein M5Y63_10830, partial [Neisseria meningitidis]|nr:hypothetical protein [Neisseria meningitidis]